jgi:hypothetical protein
MDSAAGYASVEIARCRGGRVRAGCGTVELRERLGQVTGRLGQGTATPRIVACLLVGGCRRVEAVCSLVVAGDQNHVKTGCDSTRAALTNISVVEATVVLVPERDTSSVRTHVPLG